jgi:hypothetical protein
MLAQLQSFSRSADKEHVREVERGFDAFFCQNPEAATTEAISVIVADPSGPHPAPQDTGIRILCANFLYAFIEARWRVPAGTATAAMRQAQVAIRGRILDSLLSCPLQQSKPLLRKFASCLALITRYEYPGLWPDGGPFSALINRVQQVASAERAQALFVLHLCLKAIQPLAKSQRTAGAVTEAARRAMATCKPLLHTLLGALLGGGSP